MQTCGIIILAAGGSTRMGVAKQSLEYQGTTLLQRAVNTAIHSICKPVIVVLGAREDQLRGLLNDLPIQIVSNPDWQKGMGTSIRKGVDAIRSSGVDAAMILLCDQPLITTDGLNQMVASYFASMQPMAAAAYAGALGTPAIFASTLFDELMELADSQAGKTLLKRYPQQVHPFDMPQAQIDLDTIEDFNRLKDGE